MKVQATDVFVSYKAEDRARLAPLVAILEKAGLNVWWDARIGAGADWRHEIEAHLETAKCVLVAWSKRSVAPEGHFVRDEATRALRLGTYLPVLIDPVEPPLGFGEVQALSLQGWRGSERDPRLSAVREAVCERVGRQPPAAGPLRKPPLLSRRAAIGAGAIGAAALAGGGWLAVRRGETRPGRIAVMPFLNLSDDPAQAYFSDGVTEELRSALNRLGLEVVGRVSSEAVSSLDAKTAARRLGAQHIVTGSVRRSPALMRISAQLVDGKDGVERWAQSYDRRPGDTIAIQTDIAASVARALSVELGASGRAALALGGTRDPVAQDLVFRSRQRRVTAASRKEFDQALQFADEAIRRDPHYADAQVERSMVLITISETFPADADAERLVAQAEASAIRAMRIAPRLGAAQVALARIAYARLDLKGILRRTETALEYSPDDPDVLLEAASTFATFGRHAEALRLSDRLIELDRLAARAYARRSLVMLLARRYREAIGAVDKAESISPGNPARFAAAGDAWLLLGDSKQAQAQYARMPADDYLRLTGEAMIAARSGDRVGAEKGIARLKASYGPAVTYQIAAIRAQMGDLDLAFAELERAVALRDPGLVGLTTDPFMDALRSDARYRSIVEQLGFPR